MKLDPKYKAICFDMDDTILSTHVDYKKMADVIFDETVKVGVPESALNRSDGSKMDLKSGMKYLVEHGMAHLIPVINDNAAKPLRDIEMENVTNARPFEKTYELLRKIKAMGYKTGILTRGCREYAETACKVCGIREFMDVFLARDDVPFDESKPSPKAMLHIARMLDLEPYQILYVGDQKVDFMCASGAGADFVAVATGPYTIEDWKELKPKYIYPSINEFCDDIE